MSGRLSYSDWTDMLCRHFFSETRSGQPVTLYVDEGALSELSGIPEESEAVDSLSSAVASRLGAPASGGYFKPFHLEWTGWKRAPSECPPSLPLLAVAVLAAHRMESERDIASHNYYVRFRELLGLPLSGGEPSGYGDVFPALWRGLRDWLDGVQGGRLGVSTIPANPSLPFIGYALSQALFRQSDGQRLAQFFQWIQLEPREHMEGAELLAHFRNWVRGGRQISPGLERSVTDPAFADQLGQILAAAAAQWDGVVRDPSGRRLGHVHVTLDAFPRPQLGFAASRPSGSPVQVTVVMEGGAGTWEIVALTEDWYGPILVPVSGQVLSEAFVLEGPGVALEYEPSSVVPMRQEPALGLWVSVQSVWPDEPHWVLVREDVAGAVGTFLGDHAREGWKATSTGCPDGWKLFRDVFLHEVSDIRAVEDAVRGLIPTVKNRPTLHDGLRMPGGTSTYLVGGEPDLSVPAPTDGRDWPVASVDAVDHAISGGRLQLRWLGLPEGLHQIVIEETRLRFTTIGTIGVNVPAAAATLSSRVALREGRYEFRSLGAGPGASPLRPDEVSITGVHCVGADDVLPTRLQPPVFLVCGALGHVLLGARPGELLTASEPLFPAWIHQVGLFPQYFETQSTFEVAWVLTRRRGRGWTVRAKEPLPPAGTAEDVSPEAREWSRAILDAAPPEVGDDLTRWERYVRVAQGLVR